MRMVSAMVAKALDDGDLVAHLRPAQHGDERPGRILEHVAKRADLAVEQPPGGPLRDESGHPLGRGVRAMGGPECVVDVGVGQLGQRAGELRIVLRLPRLVADVLEHEDVPGAQVLRIGPHVLADHRRGERDVGAGQLGQAIGGRAHREAGIAVLRAPEVGDEDDPGTALAQPLDRRQGGPDPGVVRHLALVQRNVEVDADEDAPAVQLTQVLERPHRSLPTRSTMRFE